MSEMLKRLQEQRNRAWEQAKALLDAADNDKRDLSAEEDAQWRQINDAIGQYDQRMADIADAEKRAASMAEAMADLDAKPSERGKLPAGGAFGDQLRAMLRGESREVTVTPDATFRDLSKGTATAGGNTVPTSFYGELVTHMIDMSAILSAGPTILETQSGETIEIPVTTAFSAAVLTAENAALTESDPAFAKRSLGAYKYMVGLQAPRELLDDTGVDLEGFIAKQCGWAVGNALGAHLITGTGSSQPSGIVTTATTGVTGGTAVAGAFTADNLIDLYYSVIAPYRASRSCAWIMRDATMGAVRKLKDTTGQYLWQPSVQLGVPDTLLGKPVYTDPNVAAVGLNAKSVIFGDISRYFVRLAGGVRFERSADFAFNTDQITFKAVIRGDGVLADQTGAVKVFAGGAS